MFKKKKKINSGKFKSTKVEIYGTKFDSKLELKCYNELLLRQKAGEIKDLRRADTFLLQEGFRHNSAYTRKKGILKKMSAQIKISYTPDFFYYDLLTKENVIVEVKSGGTRLSKDYPIRKKLFLSQNRDISFLEWES